MNYVILIKGSKREAAFLQGSKTLSPQYSQLNAAKKALGKRIGEDVYIADLKNQKGE